MLDGGVYEGYVLRGVLKDPTLKGVFEFWIILLTLLIRRLQISINNQPLSENLTP